MTILFVVSIQPQDQVHSNRDFEDIKPVILHDTPTYDNAWPLPGLLAKGSAVQNDTIWTNIY